MSVTPYPGGLWYPSLRPNLTSIADVTIDAAAEKLGAVFRIAKTGTLDKAEFRLNSVAQAPANGIRVSFQNIGAADGYPDGTQDQFRDVTSGLTANTWIVPGLMTSDGTDTGTKRSVTRGDLVAVVIEFTSFSGGDSVSLSTQSANAIYRQTEYFNQFIAAWARLDALPYIALKYSDGTYMYSPHFLPVSAQATVSVTSTGTPDEYGLRFTVPTRAAVTGAWASYRNADPGDIDLVLYDADGSTVLATSSLDKDHIFNTSVSHYFFRFPTDVILEPATAYRLVLKPLGAQNHLVDEFTVASAALQEALGADASWYRTERTDGGAWTDTTTKRPVMGLWLAGVDVTEGVGAARASGPTATANGAWLDIRPTTGEEWVVQNLYLPAFVSGYELEWYDGSTAQKIDTLNGSLYNATFRVTPMRRLRVKNVTGVSQNLGYDGVRTK